METTSEYTFAIYFVFDFNVKHSFDIYTVWSKTINIGHILCMVHNTIYYQSAFEQVLRVGSFTATVYGIVTKCRFQIWRRYLTIHSSEKQIVIFSSLTITILSNIYDLQIFTNIFFVHPFLVKLWILFYISGCRTRKI